MTTLVAYEDAKVNRYRSEFTGGGVWTTPFFGTLGKTHAADTPQAFLAEFDPSRTSTPHYHMRDQFQVVMGGKGSLGRHALDLYSVHFSRAYTPYGPLVADNASGMTCFVIRAHPDTGAQHTAAAFDTLKQIPQRRPWQVTRPASFAAQLVSPTRMLEKIPGLEDEHGLAGYTLHMQPGTRMYAPDPARSDGQFLIVAKGGLHHAGKYYGAPTLVYNEPGSGPFETVAGADGLTALVLNFPQPMPYATSH